MSYYQGDYYQGDPFLGGLVRTVGRVATGVIGTVVPGPVGTAIGRIGGSIFTRRAPQPRTLQPVSPAMPMMPRYQPPRAAQPVAIGPDGMPKKKRRRMNVTNDKALRRAVRRTDGFVKLAKRALRGTGYSVVSKSSRARRVNVRESGAGGVTVH